MNSKDVINQVEGLFENSCISLFESLNCRATAIDRNEYELESDLYDAPFACIDAGSTEIELMIGLQFPVTLLRSTYPVPEELTVVGDGRLEDWAAELANQLIGRLKTHLLARNCHVTLGLPATYLGPGFDELIVGRNEIKSIYFDLGSELCACHILIDTFGDELSFSVEVDGSVNEVVESEIELL